MLRLLLLLGLRLLRVGLGLLLVVGSGGRVAGVAVPATAGTRIIRAFGGIARVGKALLGEFLLLLGLGISCFLASSSAFRLASSSACFLASSSSVVEEEELWPPPKPHVRRSHQSCRCP